MLRTTITLSSSFVIYFFCICQSGSFPILLLGFDHNDHGFEPSLWQHVPVSMHCANVSLPVEKNTKKLTLAFVISTELLYN